MRTGKVAILLCLSAALITMASGAVVLNSSEYIGFNVSQDEVGAFNNTGLNLQGSDLYNYFQNNCPDGQVVEGINADGSFSCIDADEDQNLSEVLAVGNVANTSIDMDGNQITNIGASGTDFGANGGLTLTNTLSMGGNTISFSSYNIYNGNGIQIGDSSTDTRGDFDIAVGKGASAQGESGLSLEPSVAIGYDAHAGDLVQAIALGYQANASDTNAVAIGNNAVAPNRDEVTFGNLNGEELSANVTGNLTVHGQDAVRILNGDLYMGGNEIYNANDIWNTDGTGNFVTDGSGGYVGFYDRSNDESIVRAWEGGTVELPSGDLNISRSADDTPVSAFIENTGSSDADANLDLRSSEIGESNIRFFHDGTHEWTVQAGDDPSGALELQDASFDVGLRLQPDHDVEVPNGELDVNNDLVTGAYMNPAYTEGAHDSVMGWFGDELAFADQRYTVTGGPASFSNLFDGSISGGQEFNPGENVTIDFDGTRYYIHAVGFASEWSGSSAVNYSIEYQNTTGHWNTITNVTKGDASPVVEHDGDGMDALRYNFRGGAGSGDTSDIAELYAWDNKADRSLGPALNAGGDTMYGELDMNGNNIEDTGQINMSGSHLREVDDINFNGGGNAYSAIALPQESGASLEIARNRWGSNTIMRWNRNNVTEVFGPLDMEDNTIRYSSGGIQIGDSGTSVSSADALAIGNSASAAGQKSVALGYSADASDYEAVAIGDAVTTSGYEAVAIGVDNTIASGNRSAALAQDANASGLESAALGHNAEASGSKSVAVGEDATAAERGTVSIGENSIADARLGTAVGYGTNARGNKSLVLGYGAEAADYESVAIGDGAYARYEDVAIGESANASGEDSVALGQAAAASGYESAALGQSTEASGSRATAVGEDAISTGEGTIAVGENTVANTDHAAAFGRNAEAWGHGAFAIGENVNATGDQAYAFGLNTVATDDYEAVFGAFGGDEMDVNITGSTTVYDGLDMQNSNITNCDYVAGVNCGSPGQMTLSFTTDSRSSWSDGAFNLTSADRKDNAGELGIGYLDGTNQVQGPLNNDSLVGYWRLDKGSGEITDYSGNGYTAQEDDSGYTRGASGTFSTDATNFDGSSNMNTSFFPTKHTRAMSYWVKFDSFGPEGSPDNIGAHDDNNRRFYLGVNQTGYPHYGYGDSYATNMYGGSSAGLPGEQLNTGQWYHLVLTGDGSTARVYINGEEKDSFSYNYNGDKSNDAFYIGSKTFAGSPNYYIDGTIDEVRVYNRSLTQSEVEDLYFRGQDGVFEGNYSKVIDTDSTTTWESVNVDASIPDNTDVGLTFQARDSSGTVLEEQFIDLNDGNNDYTLTVQDSEDARWILNGTSSDPAVSWEVDAVNVYYEEPAPPEIGPQPLSKVLEEGNMANTSIDMNGYDLDNVGTLNAETKHFVQQINDTHEAVYTSQESPDARAVVEGVTTIEDGRTVVDLPNHFTQVVSETDPALRVQVTPHSLATTAVTERSPDRVVIEATKDVAVDYRVTGVREGHEDKRTIRSRDQ